MISNSTLTNPDILKYWKLIRGTTKTVLTEQELMSIGVHVICYDVLPKSGSGFYWTDSLIDVTVNGNNYISFPDIIKDSTPTFNETKNINNDSVNFKVSNVNQSVRALALGGFLKDAKMNIRMVILNPMTSVAVDSILMFSGFIDYVQAVANPNDPSNEMTIYVNSVYKKLDRQAPLLAANSVYQSYYKGDEYFSLLGQVVQNQTWRYN